MSSEIPQTRQPILMDDVPMNGFHIKMTALTFGAHFTDGYAIGSISMALAMLTVKINMGAAWQGLLASSALIGLFFGALVMGYISDKIGRQKIFLFNFVIIAIASFLQLFVENEVQLVILRLIIGYGLGGDYSVGVALLAEVIPRKPRGMLLGCMNVVWNVGYVLATLIGYYIQVTNPDAWNWLLASATIPALIVLVMRLGTPESPRWLYRQGRYDEAQAVVDKYIYKGAVIEEPEQGAATGFKVLFQKKYRKQTAFAALIFSCNVVPFFAIYTFLPTILTTMGMEETFQTNLFLNFMLILGSVIGMWATVKLYRRTFCIGGFAICSVSLLALTFLPSSQTALIIAGFVAFTLAINALNNLNSIYPPEVMPTEVRACGVGFATAISRVTSALGTFLLPIALVSIGMSATMFVLALSAIFAVIMCYFWAPETRDLTLTNAAQIAAGDEEINIKTKEA